MRPALELRDVFRVYSTPEGDAAALQGLNLSVAKQEVVAVLGPSGSGKTTLLRLLAALDRPSAGSVRIFDVEVGKLATRAQASLRTDLIGYADQHYSRALARELSARELVALPLGLRGAPRRQRLARADGLLERVGLLERKRARPWELSGGEQQRIAVCAALAHRPPLFLADEPTGELDAANAHAVFALIGELAREEGCTAMVVSHDPSAAEIADRVVRIRDGRVSEETVREGSTGDAEAIVVGRGGWLRLPEDLLARAGITSRAQARLEGRRIVVSPLRSSAAAAGGGDVRAPSPRRPEQGRQIVAELAAVSQTYGAQRVLTGLTARFRAGRLHAVTGPSGSGKTTLLQLLAGLRLPNTGEVTVDGTRLSMLDRGERAALRAARVGLVPQETELTPFLSARENVEVGLALRGISPGEATARARATLEAVGLAERIDQRVSRLSSGERGRVAIARALAARPRLLLVDEPTSRLDVGNALAVAILLARIAHEENAAVVCATHDPLVLEQADEELRLEPI